MHIGRSKTVELFSTLTVEGSEPYIGRPYPQEDFIVPPCNPVAIFSGVVATLTPEFPTPVDVMEGGTYYFVAVVTGTPAFTSPTPPFEFQGFVNGVEVATGSFPLGPDPLLVKIYFQYTVQAADILDPSPPGPGGIGHIDLNFIIRNPCNRDGVTFDPPSSIPAQLLP